MPATRLRRVCAVLIPSCVMVLGVYVSSASAAPARNGMLAFVDTSTGAPAIGVANPDGTDRRLLTRPLPTVGEPSWNRKSGLIAFDLGRTIATVRPDGSGLHRVSGAPDATDSSPAWSPDGTRLAYFRIVDTGASYSNAIMISDAHGNVQRAFAFAPGVVGPNVNQHFAVPLRWSRGGRRLIVSALDSTEHIAALSIDVGSGRRTLVKPGAGCYGMAVRAPRGDLSVCTGASGGLSASVWLMRSGKRLRRLVRLGSYRSGTFPGIPAWDPSGSRVAIGIGPHHLVVVPIDGAPREGFNIRLHAPGGPPGYPAKLPLVVSWSADGHHLAVAAGLDGWGLETVDVRSRQLKLIVAHSEDTDPRFSPDGSRLAYLHASASGSTEIRLFDGLRGRSTRLASAVAVPAAYSWSPASTDIAFVTDASSLAVVSLDGSEPRVIGPDATSDPTWSPDGATIAYDAVRLDATDTPDPANAIHFVHADGTPSPLSSIPGTSYVQWWSPDGGSIGLTVAGGGVEELQLETGAVTKRDNWHGGRGAALSPDGTRALFAALEYGKYIAYYSIFLVGLDGTLIADTDVASPAIWSPDGQFVVYETDASDARDTMAPESDAIAIASSTAIGTALASIEDASQPNWQPLPA